MSIEQIQGLWLVLTISLSMILLSPLSYWALTLRVHGAVDDQPKTPENNTLGMYNAFPHLR